MRVNLTYQLHVGRLRFGCKCKAARNRRFAPSIPSGPKSHMCTDKMSEWIRTVDWRALEIRKVLQIGFWWTYFYTPTDDNFLSTRSDIYSKLSSIVFDRCTIELWTATCAILLLPDSLRCVWEPIQAWCCVSQCTCVLSSYPPNTTTQSGQMAQ